ncbi:MAG: hypothetical protein IJC32_06100, partial [Clostridia bacterium]|nr:hypothetical protein [Clostridia bacterium]
RKKKKGFLGHAYRLIKFPCIRRGEFYLLSCVTCGHSTSANSAGPNHSLRIRWFEGVGYTVSVRHKKQCCSDIVFVVVLLSYSIPFPQPSPKTMVFSHCFPEFSLGDSTPFLKGVGRIRWSVEMVGGDRLSTSYPVGVGASTTRKKRIITEFFPQWDELTTTM